MAIQTLYQKLREQLVALTVDIEDKDNVCRMLNRRLNSERQHLGKVETDITEEYTNIIERERSEFSSKIQQETENVEQLQLRKKELLQECKDMVDRIHESERAVAIALQKINKTCDATIESERKHFRNGQEERLSKYLSYKANELRDTTEKTMQPEFSRLQQMHEEEMLSVNMSFKSKEKALREELQQRLMAAVEEERAIIRDQLRLFSKEQVERTSKEMEEMDKDQRKKVLVLQEDLERDLERYQRILQSRIDTDKQNGQREIKAVAAEGQARLQSLQDAHEEEMLKLKRNYDQKVKEMLPEGVSINGIKSPPRSPKRAVATRQKSRTSNYFDEPDEDDLEASSLGAPPLPTRLSKLTLDDSERGKNGGQDGLKSVVELDELVFDDTDLIKERDRRIQTCIQQLQAETVRMERAAKLRYEDELKQIQAMTLREETDLKRQQRFVSDQVSELVVKKQQLDADLFDANQSKSSRLADLEAVRKELKIYQDGIAVNKLKAQDNKEDCRRIQNELTRLSNKQRDTQSLRIQTLRDKLREVQSESEEEVRNLQMSQEEKLKEMDRQVKSELAQKEAEIDALRDSIETEKVKIAKLESLIKRYDQGITAGNSSKPVTKPKFNSSNIGRK